MNNFHGKYNLPLLTPEKFFKNLKYIISIEGTELRWRKQKGSKSRRFHRGILSDTEQKILMFLKLF